MPNIFYFFGFIYIAHYIKALYDVYTFSYQKDVKDKIDEIIPSKITKENLGENKKALLNNVKNSFMGLVYVSILSICSWTWIIAGALYTPETFLFYILIVISATSILASTFYAIKTVWDNKHKLFNSSSSNPQEGISSIAENVPQTKILMVLDRLARIVIAGIIIYQHFFN